MCSKRWCGTSPSMSPSKAPTPSAVSLQGPCGSEGRGGEGPPQGSLSLSLLPTTVHQLGPCTRLIPCHLAISLISSSSHPVPLHEVQSESGAAPAWSLGRSAVRGRAGRSCGSGVLGAARPPHRLCPATPTPAPPCSPWRGLCAVLRAVPAQDTFPTSYPDRLPKAPLPAGFPPACCVRGRG